MAGPATDVFVSYNAEDRRRVARLVEALEAEGLSVWWDARIGGGAHWRDDIQQHLDAARCVVVVWTRHSIGRDGNFVRDEAAHAQRRGVYLPVCLDAVEPPLGFGEVQALPLRGWTGARSDPRFRGLADAVRSCVSGGYADNEFHFDESLVTRRTLMAAAAAVAIAGVAGGAWWLRSPKSADEKRIAVLPFENLSGDPQQAYFGEGVAEELRGALARIGLQVIGRTSSDAVKDMDIKTAASKLRVATLLTGTVRRSSDLIRVSVQLVDGSNGVERWSQNYDRPPGDSIKIQTDIASKVAQALSITLGNAGRAALTLGGTSDTGAQDLYLRARELRFEVRDDQALRSAVDLLDAAIARDPNYADAYRLKADLLEKLAVTGATTPADIADELAQAEAAAKQAITHEPRLGSAYAELAAIQADGFQFAEAVESMRRALELSPEDPTVMAEASFFLQQFGDPHQALALLDRVIARDPLLGINHVYRGQVFFTLRQYPAAIADYRQAIELAPKVVRFHAFIGDSLLLMNRPAEAKREYDTQPADDILRLTGEAMIAARSRDVGTTERIIARMRELFGDASSYQYAQIYAQAGNANRAFAEFDDAVRAKDSGLLLLKRDPFVDPIRGDPRYGALLKRLNFPSWD